MAWLTHLPFTLAFLAMMFGANWAAGTLSGRLPFRALAEWGMSHQRLIRGEAFRLLTGTFLSHNLGMFLRQTLFAAVVIGVYELQSGSLQAVLMFVTTNLAGTLIVLLGILPLLDSYFPNAAPRTLFSLDVGMSAGGFGLLGAILVGLPYVWGLVLLVLAAIFLKTRIKFEPIADAAHVVCLLLGIGLQFMILSWNPIL